MEDTDIERFRGNSAEHRKRFRALDDFAPQFD
jgi:hypothetical protein